MLGGFLNAIKTKADLSRLDLDDFEKEKAVYTCDLVYNTMYKYTLARMDRLLRNATFSFIFKEFTTYFKSENGDNLVPASLRSVVNKRALKKAIVRIEKMLERRGF